MTTVTLKHPVDHNGKTIDALTFRRARFGDFCASDAFDGENSKTAALLASMAGVPITTIKALDMDDMTSVLTVAGPLMGNDPAPAAVQPPA